jgi:glyoxylase-like metal-dependent hydrolase (beta-lactamase superfamily II)
MYRLNELGDCFLLTFTSGTASSRLLIDCGSFRNTTASIAHLKTITTEIQKALDGKPLDVVVGTHQHNDHLSGFVHCEKAFQKMKVQRVWLSWLDNPTDPKAKVIGETHDKLKVHLAAARDALHKALKGKTAARPTAARSLEVLDDMLGFYGASGAGIVPEIPKKGVSILKSIGREKPVYLLPGHTLDMPGLPPGSVKIHVLGPPRNDDLLYRKDPRSGESYDKELASAATRALKLLDAAKGGKGGASREEENYPFNQKYKCRSTGGPPSLRAVVRRYNGRGDAWRKIDDDWTQQAGALALYLDTFTNNSSLVLAFELVDSRKVLLFAADAQTGNWLSWKDVKWDDSAVKTDDLLARTVFYKVGHHASHNATLVEHFEKMNRPDLVALIPVHKKDPNITKKNGWKMPATNLFKRLVEKTAYRVLQMDGVNPPDCNPDKNPAKAAWQKTGIKPRVTEFSIELDIAG